MPPDFAIETVALTRNFDHVRAVCALNLHVPRGGVYGFLGPNGAGKTTTIRMLLGLIRPTGGEVRIFSRSLDRQSRRILLRQIGAMVEAPSLYPHLTGHENLRVVQRLLGLSSSHIGRVLSIVRLHADAHRQVRTYSQGMRQRLGIAQALLAQPDLVILDEPTNGLDPAGIQEIRELIRGFPVNHGITVFLSSHLLAEVEQTASCIGIVGRGRLLFEGTADELRSRRPERLVIEVDRPDLACRVLNAMSFAVTGEESILTVDVHERADVARVASALTGAGLSLYQLRTFKPSLEELFLDLTSTVKLGAPADQEVAP